MQSETVDVTLPTMNRSDLYTDSEYEVVFDLVVISVYSILSLIICSGNILVIVAVLKTRKLQTISNVYVVGLAIADLVIGLVAVPLYIVWLLSARRWTWEMPIIGFYDLFIIAIGINGFCVGASLAFMFLIAIERHTAIFYPFFYLKHYTIKRTIISGYAMGAIIALSQSLVFIEAKKTFTPTVVTFGATQYISPFLFLFMF